MTLFSSPFPSSSNRHRSIRTTHTQQKALFLHCHFGSLELTITALHPPHSPPTLIFQSNGMFKYPSTRRVQRAGQLPEPLSTASPRQRCPSLRVRRSFGVVRAVEEDGFRNLTLSIRWFSPVRASGKGISFADIVVWPLTSFCACLDSGSLRLFRARPRRSQRGVVTPRVPLGTLKKG